MIAETIFSAVSAAGLGIAAVTAYRKRFLSATRIAAYSLVPVGLVMTGVVKWVAHTAFSPVAWLGFVVLGVAWLLFLGTRAVERRRGGTRKERRAAAKASGPAAIAVCTPRPVTTTGAVAVTAGTSASGPPGPRGRAGPGTRPPARPGAVPPVSG
ncbi:hypothetical protein [Streptomyces sp. SID1121]|uniref:hypothetical protein n=1 Tax=Streptomyces sp. SID1121 TaxID=3425888 RepID=UPI004056FE76